MAELRSARTVLFPDYTAHPALPDDVLREVFGSRRINPRVEFVVVYFEYLVRGTPSLFARRRYILSAMDGRIDANNVYDFIALLAKRKVAAQFFELTQPVIDSDGALRNFLFSHDVLIDTIRLYAPFSGLSPKHFLDGFAMGVAESFAAVVFDLLDLLKLVARAQADFLRSLVAAAGGSTTAIGKLFAQAMAVGHAFEAILRELNPARIPDHVVKTWKQWNADFERHLENLDAHAAGRVLGRIGGDLWQLLTGFIALGPLLKVGARAAMQYAPLLVSSVRKTAAKATAILKELVQLVRAIGVVTIQGLPTVGMAVLKTLVPPGVFEAIVRQGRAVVSHLDDLFTLVPAQEFAMAAGGAPLGRPFGVVWTHKNRPVLMATVTESLPAPSGFPRAVAADDLDKALDALWGHELKPFDPSQLLLYRAEAAAVRVGMLAKQLDLQILKEIQRTSYQVFRELNKRGRFNAGYFGVIVEQRALPRIEALIKQVAPTMRFIPKKTLKGLVESLFVKAPKELPKRLRKLLDEPMHKFLRRHPDLLDLIGDGARAAAAKSDKSFIEYLRQRFNWTTKGTPTVGRLESDLILVDHEASRAFSLDLTSSTNAEKYASLLRKAADDLGATRFKGDLDNLREAYRKLAKREIPADVKRDLDDLTWHAVRETVIRQRALEEIFGPYWIVSSYEMTYGGLGKLFRLIREP